jgi:hypothetical protein
MPSSVTFNIAHTAISPWSSRSNDTRTGVTETQTFIQQVHNIQSNDVWRNIDKCRFDPFATTTAILNVQSNSVHRADRQHNSCECTFISRRLEPTCRRLYSMPRRSEACPMQVHPQKYQVMCLLGHACQVPPSSNQRSVMGTRWLKGALSEQLFSEPRTERGERQGKELLGWNTFSEPN